ESQIRLITPGAATAVRFAGTGGGKMSRGVTHTGPAAALSTVARVPAEAARTMKQRSTPNAARGSGVAPASAGGGVIGASNEVPVIGVAVIATSGCPGRTS